LNDERKVRDRSSVSEVYMDGHNQNMIAIVTVRRSIDDAFLSGE
jgi:hypothetical protein